MAFLYWAANFWNQTPDPWLDPVTYISGFDCSGGWVLNGEGSLIYPGDQTKRYTGQPDVIGPVSSIRMELLREGIEDYEYLWMLKDLGDKEFAETDSLKYGCGCQRVFAKCGRTVPGPHRQWPEDSKSYHLSN